jgi:hypothetical protein
LGEAKRRRLRAADFCRQHPVCCFCGGVAPSTTIDHVPARTMFAGRSRPNGLEFPACSFCNNSTSSAELLVAMFARMFPDASNPEDLKEVQNLIKDAFHFFPALAREMMPTHRQVRNARPVLAELGPGVSVMNAESPILNLAMRIFAYKLTCALHFEQTGNIVPADGAVGFRWFSNYDAVKGDIPSPIFELAQGVGTLQQGKWTVADQFNYTWAVADTNEAGLYVGYFRQSFIVAGFVWPPSREIGEPERVSIKRPATAIADLVSEFQQITARPR